MNQNKFAASENDYRKREKPQKMFYSEIYMFHILTLTELK